MNKNINTGRERLGAAAAGVRGGVSNRLGDLWWAFMLRGLLAAALGVCAFIWPSASITILTRLVGLFFLADGITAFIGLLRGSERGASLLGAVFSLAIGVALLFWPGASGRTLLLAFGVWALVNGVSLIFSSRQAETADEVQGPMTTVGIILIILGVVLLVWPGAGVVTIAWVIGAAALLLAALLIFLALRFKRLKGRVEISSPESELFGK